jgi:phytoene dehydrogenase-like protein
MRAGPENKRSHAVVIGASIAGLCAARVLSDFYDRVTLFERDDLPGTPVTRKAVPQGRHLHLLMARRVRVRRALSRVAR